MKHYQDVMPHGPVQEVFKDVFFVTGTMKNEFFGSMWQFSRNMTVVREDGDLTIINSVRLRDDALEELDRLGKVINVVRIGDMHGVDDPFYIDRYQAKFWAMPGMRIQAGLTVDRALHADGEMPFKDCSFFEFKTVARPEGILRLDREGGIMIACDSLQNWIAPDQFFDENTIPTMEKMNFFKKAGLGLAWLHESQPKAEDFIRLKKITFKHALCGHGNPLKDEAQEEYHRTIAQFFNL